MSIAFLSGSSEYLFNDTALVSDVPLSMHALFRQDNTTDDCIVSIGDKDAFNQIHMLSTLGGPTVVIAGTRGGGGVVSADATTTYSTNTWYSVGGVWASSTSRKIYFEGAMEAENTSDTTASSIDTVVIGARPNKTKKLDGRVAEIAIWNVALTDAEMLILSII